MEMTNSFRKNKVGDESLASFNSTTVLKAVDSSSDSSEDECKETNWRLVVIAGIVAFLAALENTAVGVSEYPYMTKIDPEATSQFFGAVASLSKVGHAVFAIIFTYWSYRSQNIRLPLIFGRILAFVACCIYLCVEFLPSNRRYLMAFCYFLFGIAASSSAVLRMYIVQVSTEGDRSRAYSCLVLANMFSIIIGPVIQLFFSGISYPGYQILPNVRLHLFSAPIWIAALTNFISLAVICTVLKTIPRATVAYKKEKTTMYNIDYVRQKLRKFISMDVIWSLVIVCWIERIAIHLAVVTLQTVIAPFFMTAFGWSPEKIVIMSAICMGVVGILSLVIAGLLMTSYFGKRMSPRFVFLFALGISVFMYLLSYPYPKVSHPMPKWNGTLQSGCNPSEYSWCDTANATWPEVFLPVIVLVMAFGLPLGAISLDTIYSKILGNIDQSVMQGAMVAAEDVVLILGPLYASWMFTSFGQGSLWLINGILTILACVLWAVFLPQMKAYK